MFKKGNVPWCTGLTKETDARIKRIGENKKGRTYEQLYGEKLANEIKRKQGLATRQRLDLSKWFIKRCKKCNKWFAFYECMHPNQECCSRKCANSLLLIKRDIENKEYECKFCGKIFNGFHSIGAHVSSNHSNKDYKRIGRKTSKTLKRLRAEGLLHSWNKNLTAETDERVRRNAESTKQSYVNNPELRKLRVNTFRKANKGRPSWNKNKTSKDDTRIKSGYKRPEHAKIMREKYEKGEWTPPVITNKDNKEWMKNWLKNLLKEVCKKPTGLEQEFGKLFYKYELPFNYCGNGTLIIGGRNPDYVESNGKKICVEVANKNHKIRVSGWDSWQEYEKSRIEHFAKYGWKCLVLWQDELEDESKLLNKIKAFLNG